MARIPAQLVKQLRELTGARVMDCKRALQESQGNLESAIALLREKDLIRAEGLQQNEANQGIVESYIHSNKSIGVLIEVNCQTDFVARSATFQELARNLAMQIAAIPVESVESLLSQTYIRDSQVTVKELLDRYSAAAGEAIQVKRFSRFGLS
ncbi:MAG: translation elongation factor Ts [Oscillatoriales cyanobacterium RU_3_3]|nr:translation elongation factor Ts [Oscillatoriales cyanobacterium RU_3_3]NJR23404.1 translation elongation factor Ts [Richelia sp. CSU_2_1]